MFRIAGVCLVAVASLGSFGTSVHASTGPSRHHTSSRNWDQRDTAVYVVSTLNLLRNHAGKSVSSIFQHQFGVSRFDVLADGQISGLYFVELKRDDGGTFGAYAYQMGWPKPLAVSASVARFGVKLASSDILADYKSDSKTLLASFSSTLPQ